MTMRKIYFAIVLAILAAGCGKHVTVKEISVVPEPVFVLQKEGSFTLKDNPRISLAGIGQNSPTARYVMSSLRHARMHPRW